MEQAFPTPNSIPSSKIPPAYHTRKRDKAPLPSSEQTFVYAYQFDHKASLFPVTLSLSFAGKRGKYREVCLLI